MPTIERIILHMGFMPVNCHFSFGSVNRFSFTIIEVHAGGLAGLGEVVHPVDPLLHELAQRLLGQPVQLQDELLDTEDDILSRRRREGFSHALADLYGQLTGRSLSALMGTVIRQRVPLMPCLFPTSPAHAGELARRFLDQGYQYLKIKLIGNRHEDIARVRAVRTTAKPTVYLQGDMNEACHDVSSASRLIRALADEGLNAIEDPLRGGPSDYAALRHRRGERGPGIMIDRMARHSAELAEVLRLNAVEFVNLHPANQGSFRETMLRHDLCRKAGVQVMIGGTGFAGPGTAAYQHLSGLLGTDLPCGELGGVLDHGMPESLVAEMLPIQNGTVILPETPGIGVKLAKTALTRYATKRLELKAADSRKIHVLTPLKSPDTAGSARLKENVKKG